MALPSIRRSCPCEPTKVLDKKGAKSTMISRRSGQTEPSANSNFWVKVASLKKKLGALLISSFSERVNLRRNEVETWKFFFPVLDFLWRNFVAWNLTGF